MVYIFWPVGIIYMLMQRGDYVYLVFGLGYIYVAVLYLIFLIIPTKTDKAKQKNLIAYSSLLILGLTAIYFLGRLPHKKVAAIYTLAWGNPISISVIGLGLIAGLVSLYRIKKEKRAEKLKHGPNFCPPTLDEGNVHGIIIGKMKKKVLPGIAQQFYSSDNDPVVMAYDRLSRGVTALGDMGSGKSRLLFAIEAGIRKQYPEIPILIHDPKGEWLRTCYNPETDLIFAPHDERSCGWKIWEDFKQHPELRHSLISTAVESHHSGNSDRFWSDSAIQLLKTAVSKPDVETAKKFLKLKKDENAGDKTFQSIYATAALSFRDIATIDYISKNRPAKTIDELLTHKGRIFLLNNPSCATEQTGALALMLSAFLIQAISQPDLPEPQLRAAVFIDEALTFHLPADVERAVYSQSRSKGLCIVAAAQRLPDSNYGERGMWANQAYHYFAMRVSDLKTRETLSQRTGKIIFSEEQTSKSDHGNTKSDIERQHSAILPESFGTLSPREFILFHPAGIAPGVVANVPGEQRDDIKTIQYTPQDAALEFLSDI